MIEPQARSGRRFPSSVRRGGGAIVIALCLVATATGPVRSGAAAPGVRWFRPVAVDAGIDRDSTIPVDVVVQAAPGRIEEAVAVIEAGHGQVGARLPIIDGFEARLSGVDAWGLSKSDALRAITLDRTVRFEEYTYDDTTTASNFAKAAGASSAWVQGYLGAGIGVAVIDTGISPMPDFDQRIVHGPDLSGEGSIVDTYGHGTVMAGLVGGSGADSAGRSGGGYTGVAPRATLVAVKAAGRNGAADVSTLLQAMHWVAAYHQQYNIRVVSLSWGTTSTQKPAIDPLNYAVERLWRLGIVVVVAAGNQGPFAKTITKPGDDPVVLTVGAYDDRQNVDPADDKVASWSSRGPTAAGLVKPDVVAPGRTVVATRSFGSYIERENPKALVSPSYIKGSGTSQATAITAGVVALLLQARPELTPDQVKAVLKGTALPINGATATQQGAGRVRLAPALSADAGPPSWQAIGSDGLGSIEASRGGMNVETDCGQDGTVDVIKGEIDVRCEPWVPAGWTGAAWTGAAWTGAAWTGAAWTGAAWTGAAWTGGAWTGGAWTGAAWTGAAWTGGAWTGAAWTGAAWTGAAWTGGAWTGTGYGEDEEEVPNLFATAFWGGRPKYGEHIPGEVSERNPKLKTKGRAW